MITILFVCLIVVGVVVLVDLLLTLRLIRWLRAIEALRKQEGEREILPELLVSQPAPDFKAKTLAGEWVRLAHYAGRSVVFIFVSPHCGSCRRKMPLFMKLGLQAKERAGVEFVLVSDSSAAETYTWIDTIREEDGIEVNLPFLIAPRPSEFLKLYNPRGLTPYYSLINEQGIIQSRDPLEMGEWSRLQREWGGPTLKSTSRYS